MSDAAPAASAAPAQAAPAKRSRLSLKLILILAFVLIAGAGGAAAYFFMFAKPVPQGPEAKAEAPMPTYLEIKPFVVSMRGADDASHFVQLGINLMLSGADLGSLVSADEPEVDDAMRLSALQFKIEDIQTPPGVEKLRTAILGDVNRVLLKRLGAERVEKLSGGSKDAVKTLYFTQLVIE